jgi:hypothetical protein
VTNFHPYWAQDHIKPSQRRSRYLREVIDGIIKHGRASHHSAMGTTMARIIDGLEERGTPYVIKAWPGRGYSIEKGEPLP